MNRVTVLAITLFAGTLVAQHAAAAAPAITPSPAAAASDVSDPPDSSHRSTFTPLPTSARPAAIEHDGQTFTLANRTATANVETDEYLPAGDKIADWNQIVTVQRITLPKPAGTDEFLAYFQKRVLAGGATVDVVKQSAPATVFAVRFPKADNHDEQVMICLAFIDPDQPARLAVVQYAIKPLRAPVGVVEMRLRSWKDSFFRRAEALAAKAAAQ